MAVCAFATSSAFASTKQVTIVEEQNGLNSNPTATLEKLKAMGVTEVKYSIQWAYLLPYAEQTATTAPAGSTSPTFYTTQFGALAKIDQAAAKVGIKLDFLVGGPAPRWAEGAGCSATYIAEGICNVNATDYGVLVAALGAYFNGSVPGTPAVRWWSIWNEPNYGVNLQPELTGSTTYTGAVEYRNLVNAAWKSLQATGHKPGADTIVFGELAPRGIAGSKAVTNIGYKPVQFMAALYCVTTAGKRLTGATATANQCGSSASAFKSANPALFNASGVADHPYAQGIAPNVGTADCKVGAGVCTALSGRKADPLWTDLAGINNLTSGLTKDLHAYGSGKQFPIWNTEYGYWTTISAPSKYHCVSASEADCDASPTNAATYSNEAEYISYKNPRIVSFDQYQLYMPTTAELADSAWSDGLLTPTGSPEPTYDPWEVPLWIPTTTLKKVGNITVWGGVKPATFGQAAGIKPQVAIQFKAKSGGWKTLKTQTVPTGANNPGSYFQTTVKVTSSGSVRLVYTAGTVSLDSRTQAVTVK